MTSPIVTAPFGLTVRQLLQQVDRTALLDFLDGRCETGNREGYANVIETLLAMPVWTAPMRFHVLLSYYPTQTYAAGTKHEFVDEESVHVHLLNLDYEAPPAGLEPWGGSEGVPLPAGKYDCNAEKHNEVFGFGGTPWGALVDSPILLERAEGVRRLLPSDIAIAAEILWEWTWMGWSPSEQEAFWGSIEETVKGIKDGTIETVSAEEVLNDLDELMKGLGEGESP